MCCRAMLLHVALSRAKPDRSRNIESWRADRWRQALALALLNGARVCQSHASALRQRRQCVTSSVKLISMLLAAAERLRLHTPCPATNVGGSWF